MKNAPEKVYTRDDSSGMVHVRIRDGDRLLVDERDNLDQAGSYTIIESVVDVEPEHLCRHCFQTWTAAS